MQRYIEQLVNDIRAATHKVQPPHDIWLESGADPDDELELEDMSYVEEFVYGKKKKISKITGIESNALPPPRKLTDSQKALLAVELERMLQVFHFYLDFPESYPAHLRYRFIRKLWNKKHVPLSFGENHIEFCDYDESNCPFPGYCKTCEEVSAQMKFDEEEMKGKSFDFDFNIADLLPTPEQVEAWFKERNIEITEGENCLSIGNESENTENNSNIEQLNGYYDDGGNEISPDSVPVPGLCIVCRKYHEDDWDENLLCLMTRFDQRNDSGFECGAFDRM
jgi:hypothetical protein